MNSNLFRRTTEAATGKAFSFVTFMDTATDTKHITWRPARLSKGKKWYISYQYRNPETGRMQKIKVYENINRIHDEKEKESYAKDVVDGVNRALKAGYNPFEVEEESHKTWTIQQSVLFFKQHLASKGIEASSVRIYGSTIKRFLKWVTQRGIQNSDVNSITSHAIELYLDETREKQEWSNRSFNNERNLLKTAFIFLQKRGIVSINPVATIEKKKVISKKHRYYDEKTMTRVLDILKEIDPYLFFACQVVYYLCIRSEKELKLFKVGNIFPDRMQVLINGSDSKTSRDRFIPMPDEMLSVFKERGIFDYPDNYYVFGVPHKNKFVRDGEPGPEPFGKGFFSERFSRLREKMKISADYTIFSFRHTRAIHLKLDGAPDHEIMSLFGHTDFATTVKYLRDIGLTVSENSINKRTRKL